MCVLLCDRAGAGCLPWVMQPGVWGERVFGLQTRLVNAVQLGVTGSGWALLWVRR